MRAETGTVENLAHTYPAQTALHGDQTVGR